MGRMPKLSTSKWSMTYFGDQIGCNMEVFVNDIILKSKKVDMLPQHMRETFSKSRQVKMKLNRKKCVFGVPKGKCLGLIISEQGIEADPEKIKAIQDMPTSKNVRDMQHCRDA